MQIKKKLLIVEDEWKIARFLQMELEHEGYEIGLEQNGLTAYSRIIQESFDLIILDIMLPGMNGLEICQKVRELSSVPIIMLTAKDDVSDKVQGLDRGADDYLTKPFAIEELFARIRTVFRKYSSLTNPKTDTVLSAHNLILYPERYEAMINECTINLTKKEYDLLEFLLRNKNIVLGRERIIQEVWGYDYLGDTNVVDVYIRYLRSKLDDQYGCKYIHTVRGVGYVVKD